MKDGEPCTSRGVSTVLEGVTPRPRTKGSMAWRFLPYELGVSPRGTLALARMSQASAYLRNKTYVTPDDIREVFMDVCAHRIILNAKARISHLTPAAVLEEILKATPGPSLRKS